jgi:glyoxylase-like metal-dependent hydrolase (beta-lactamase superfamily II)
VNAVLTPGHTPGHLVVVLSSLGERALLLGDAATHPVQLEEPGWHSFGDVEAGLARRNREWLWRELAAPRTVGTGAHFPGLRFGRVEGRAWRWVT